MICGLTLLHLFVGLIFHLWTSSDPEVLYIVTSPLPNAKTLILKLILLRNTIGYVVTLNEALVWLAGWLACMAKLCRVKSNEGKHCSQVTPDTLNHNSVQ